MKEKDNELGQSVIKGSLILVTANLLVKIIGALFKIPITNLLGNEGMGYFSSAYTIYSGLFTVATAGLPVAIAKMIAESTAHGNLRELKRIHRVSYIIFALVGIIGSSVLFFGADSFVKAYGDNSICIKLVAPALFFVAIMSVYRGFFQGLSDMYPTAISELIETGAKLLIGYAATYFLLKKGLLYGAAGAISGVTAGSVFGCVFLIYMFLKKRKKIYASLDGSLKPPSYMSVFGRLMGVALPVTVSASVFTITNLIDVFQIGKRLSLIADKIPQEQIDRCIKNMDEAIAASGDRISAIVNGLYGMYTSKVITMLNLLPAIVVAVCLPLVPAIARSFETKDYSVVSKTTRMSVKFTVVFSLPGAVGIGVLSGQILRALFGSNDAEFLLKIITPAIVCVSLVLVTNAILQATGNVIVPVINIAISGITKVIINYFLLVIPTVNISGVAIGSVACYFIYMTLNLYYVIKVTKPNLSIYEIAVKPFVSSAVMGAAVFAVNGVLTHFLGTSRIAAVICTAAGIGVGGIIYLVMLFVTGTLKEEEIKELPKGDKIVNILTETGLIKRIED